MISAKRLVQMAKKWQRMATLTRKRLTSPITTKEADESCCTSTSVAGIGHCVVYSVEGCRFKVPLTYLDTAIFAELLKMSEEEFGFAGEEGRIMLPCDAVAMEYMLSLLSKGASEEVERAFLSSMEYYEIGLAETMGVSQQIAVPSF